MQAAVTSARRTPVPCRRLAQVRGPMPRSISMTPAGERRSVALPEEPLARIQSSRDIRVARVIDRESCGECLGEQDALGEERMQVRDKACAEFADCIISGGSFAAVCWLDRAEWRQVPIKRGVRKVRHSRRRAR